MKKVKRKWKLLWWESRTEKQWHTRLEA